MHTPLACSDYYEASAPPHGHRSTTDLPTTGPAARRGGRPETVPTFTKKSIDEGGVRLDPDSIATPTPQAFGVASPPDQQTGYGVDPHRRADTRSGADHALHTGPYPSGLSRFWTYGASDSGSSRTPSHHC